MQMLILQYLVKCEFYNVIYGLHKNFKTVGVLITISTAAKRGGKGKCTFFREHMLNFL